MDHTERQARYFDHYESCRDPRHPVVAAFVRPKLALIERHVDLTVGGRLLDVGCGNGLFANCLRTRCPCVGVDISRGMLQRTAGFPAVQGTAFALPFRSGSFQVVFCANLLHHSEGALAEMARVSGRWVVLVEPNAANPPMWLFGLLRREERGLLRFSRHRLRRLVEAAGLETVLLASSGMITQNVTPEWMIPFLRPFDRTSPWGAYTVSVSRLPS